MNPEWFNTAITYYVEINNHGKWDVDDTGPHMVYANMPDAIAWMRKLRGLYGARRVRVRRVSSAVYTGE